MKAGELVARSLRQHFHAAVVIVAHPSGNSEDVRLALHEPAEADSLHASANQKTASFYRLLRISHFGELSSGAKNQLCEAKLIRSRRIAIISDSAGALGNLIGPLEECLAVTAVNLIRVGILRLRENLAARCSRSAQDDN